MTILLRSYPEWPETIVTSLLKYLGSMAFQKAPPGASRDQLCIDCIQFQKYRALNKIDLDD